MSVALATQNPEAHDRLSNPVPLPKRGHWVLFKPRPSEMRAGMATVPALVMTADERNQRLDLLIIYDVDDMRRVERVAAAVGDDQGWLPVERNPFIIAPLPDGLQIDQQPGHIMMEPEPFLPVSEFDAFCKQVGDALFGENEKPETPLLTMLVALTARIDKLEREAAKREPIGKRRG